ncbi:transport protein sec24 [Cystoisospora suis]|uniref:Transport protein sec24 n=1 Tax=Cystoisospora suis TaxID=483139 RepID=A0A2C6JMF9_9APIC|nr:transport protein sec24 [Cystoisospora suis]
MMYPPSQQAPLQPGYPAPVPGTNPALQQPYYGNYPQQSVPSQPYTNYAEAQGGPGATYSNGVTPSAAETGATKTASYYYPGGAGGSVVPPPGPYSSSGPRGSVSGPSTAAPFPGSSGAVPPRTPYYPTAGAGTGYPYPSGAAPSSAASGPGMGGLSGADGGFSGSPAQQLLQDVQQFNAPRHFTRAAVARVPHSSSLQQKLHLPVGLVVRPLAPVPAGFAEVPSVNFGSCGVVVRCKRCRTYINPFVHWEAHGRRWVCNLCGFVNDTPQFYMRGLDDQGKREDRFERPELSMGSVEFVAPADYMIRPPQPPAYLFLIDVSAAAVASGLVESACMGIRSALLSGRLPGCTQSGGQGEGQVIEDGRTMVGILTYDSAVHFYALNGGGSGGLAGGKHRPQVLVMPEIDDVFLPLSDDLFVNYVENKDAVLKTLETIPHLWRSNTCIDNCMGSALKAALLVMKHVGGKIMLFSSHPPTIGELVTKRSGGLAGADGAGGGSRQQQQQPDREVELLKPASEVYQQFAQQLTQSQVSVDLFIAPSSCAPSVVGSGYGAPPSFTPAGGYQGGQQGPAKGSSGAVGGGTGVGCPYYDLATVLPLAQLTGGEVRYYAGFHKLQQGEQLENEVFHIMTRTTGWEAVMRIRVSRGWRISSRHGRFYLRGTDLFVLPTVNADSTFSVLMEIDEQSVGGGGGAPGAGSLVNGSGPGGGGGGDNVVAVQAALLYTNSEGERRIRVHTFCLPVSQNIQDIVSSMDPEVVSCLLVQRAIEQSLRSKIADGRVFLQTSCSQLLSVLHSVGSSAGAAAHPVLPSLPHYGASAAGGGSASGGALVEAGRLVALLILGSLKSTAFRPLKDVTTDQRVFEWSRLLSLPVDMICAYLHPRMLALHTLPVPGEGAAVLDGNEEILLPPQLRLTSEEMTQDGAYVVENGEEMLLWIGRSVAPHWLSSVLGVQSLDSVHPDIAASSIGDTQAPLGLHVRAVTEALRRERAPDWMRLSIVRQGDPHEQKFFAQLMEDRVPSLLLTFAEFLQKVDVRAQLQAPALPLMPGSAAGPPPQSMQQQQRTY